MTLDTTSLLSQVKQLADITSGVQKDYYTAIYNNSKEIKCISIYDVMSEKEIQIIKKYISPQKKECYKNATRLTMLFPDKIKYCEGKLSVYGFGIDHAFNKIGDNYIDITAEFALGEDVTENDYLVYAEYDAETVDDVLIKNEFYGDIFQTIFKENLKK